LASPVGAAKVTLAVISRIRIRDDPGSGRVLDETMPHATTVLQFGAAALSLVVSGLAVVQHTRALRKRWAADRVAEKRDD
jgi:hypothetical protein